MPAAPLATPARASTGNRTSSSLVRRGKGKPSFWLAEKLLFDESHVLVGVEKVWLMPSCTRHDPKIGRTWRGGVKSYQPDAEYLAQGIQTIQILIRRFTWHDEVNPVAKDFVGAGLAKRGDQLQRRPFLSRRKRFQSFL